MRLPQCKVSHLQDFVHYVAAVVVRQLVLVTRRLEIRISVFCPLVLISLQSSGARMHFPGQVSRVAAIVHLTFGMVLCAVAETPVVATWLQPITHNR